MRASITSELIFEDVRLDDSARLPEARGLRAPLSCLTQARYGISWGAIGAARSCYHCALDYTKSRKQFARPLAGYQLVQNKLVTMLTEIAQLVCLRLGQLKDANKCGPSRFRWPSATTSRWRWTSRVWRAILRPMGLS
jgi:glutaryl-CoA dehydrogenase